MQCSSSTLKYSPKRLNNHCTIIYIRWRTPMWVRFFFTVASPFVVSRAAHDFPVASHEHKTGKRSAASLGSAMRPAGHIDITIACCCVVSRAAHDLPVGSAARPRAAHITVVSPFVVSEGAHDFPELHLLLLQAFAAFACICSFCSFCSFCMILHHVLCTMYNVLCIV